MRRVAALRKYWLPGRRRAVPGGRMDLAQLLRFCEAERDWLVETTSALARLESPTSDKERVDQCGAELARRLVELGASVDIITQDAAGDHIRASIGSGSEQLLLLGHFDTVWPVGQTERMPVIEDGAGRLSGPGVYDMKAGIAIGMLAVRALVALDALPRRRLVLLLTSDEERGSVSSRLLVENEARNSDAVCVLEPSLPGGALKTARKGSGEYLLCVDGVPAHAGIEPENGASAIHELARQIVALEELRDHQRGILVNVGQVEGGSRPNVVAEEARCVIDVRVGTAADREHVEATFGALKPVLPGTSLRVSGGFSRPPLERTDAVVRLFRIAREVASKLGHELQEGSTGGGSDGNFTAALGVPTLDGLGAVGGGAHALHEHVDVAQLPWRAALLAGLIDRLAAE